MQKLYLNDKELAKVRKMKLTKLERRKRWFERKKLNHFNTKRLKVFFEKYIGNCEYSEKLYEIRFKSSFALYLYLYLKSLAKGYELEGDADFSISQPVDVNFAKLVETSRMTRNTVRNAFWELVGVGLVIYSDDLKPEYHNSTKAVMVLNDKYVVGFDEKSKQVIYSINSNEKNKG